MNELENAFRYIAVSLVILSVLCLGAYYISKNVKMTRPIEIRTTLVPKQ